jgi:hypothetical protein
LPGAASEKQCSASLKALSDGRKMHEQAVRKLSLVVQDLLSALVEDSTHVPPFWSVVVRLNYFEL